MGYKINVFVGDELVDDIELDIEPDKVIRIGVDKDSGEIASIGSPVDNTAVNIRLYVRTNNAMTGEEAQAVAAERNAEAAKEAVQNQIPPADAQPPDTILPTSDGVVVQEQQDVPPEEEVEEVTVPEIPVTTPDQPPTP